MKKAIVYSRVSSEAQEEGSSLQSQEAANAKHAEKLGFEVIRKVRETFSGAYLFDRPELNKIRDEVRRGDVDAVVVYALDRLSRNIAHLHIIKEEFDLANTELLFATETFDNTAEGKLLQSVRGYVAEVEREKIRERTMRGRRTKVLDGTLSNRRPLYGYILTDDGRREPCPVTSHIVRQMFLDILDGSSLRQIAEELNAKGVPTAQGGLWYAQTIAFILKNPAYCGKLTMFRYTHEKKIKDGRRSETSKLAPKADWITVENGNTPAIVTEDQFTQVQAVLDNNKRQRRRRIKHDYLLRGMVRCARCGRTMAPRAANDGYRTYVCTSKQSAVTNCGVKMLRADWAEDSVWQKMEAYIREPDELRALVHSAMENADERKSTLEAELTAVRKSISKCQAEIARMEANLLQADPRSFAGLNKVLSKKHDELDRLHGVRDGLLKDQGKRSAASHGIDEIITLAMQVISSMEFADRVAVLKLFGLQVVWDGEQLKPSIDGLNYCKDNLDRVDNKSRIAIAL